MIVKLFSLLKETFFSPLITFKEIHKGRNYDEIYLIFCFGILITFIKSFLVNGPTSTFFVSSKLNVIFTFLGNPQVSTLLTYSFYFISLSITLIICKRVSRQTNAKKLFLSFMSISGVGVIMQIFFIGFKFFLPKILLTIMAHSVFLWIFLLSAFVIKENASISLKKSMAILLVSTAPFIIILGAFTPLAPYLLWLLK